MNTVALSPRRSSRWPWLMGALLVLFLGALALAWMALSAADPAPFSVVIDGERVFEDVDLSGLHPGHLLTLAAVLALAMLALMVVVPMAVLIVLACVLVGVLAVVGLPLLAAAVVLGVLLSPLWLAVWLLFKLLA
jgi:hypothetical protein